MIYSYKCWQDTSSLGRGASQQIAIYPVISDLFLLQTWCIKIISIIIIKINKNRGQPEVSITVLDLDNDIIRDDTETEVTFLWDMLLVHCHHLSGWHMTTFLRHNHSVQLSTNTRTPEHFIFPCSHSTRPHIGILSTLFDR